mgnify:CR=1 FL=1
MINEFLNTSPKIVDTEKNLRHIEGEIRFDHVSFTYPDSGIEALRDVSFHVPAGRSLAIAQT